MPRDTPQPPPRCVSALPLSVPAIGLVLLVAGLVSIGAPAPAIADDAPGAEASTVFDPVLFQAVEARNIGPFRGGRSVAVAGVVQDHLTYYMGTTGGGLWRTTDAGLTWTNISDGHFATGSVGAVAVAPSDPNVIWVGMGEACIRGVMTTHGDGVYRSTDRGKTWQHLGLESSQHISKVLIHPSDPDIAWVGAQGHAWGPNAERGVYKTTDGGKTWQKTLFVGPSVGVADMALDASNPRILYAALWRHRRYPWKIDSGGGGSEEDPAGGIWKSTDGGETWNRLETGLPEAPGKIGVAVSPARSDRVWAIVEAEKGGLYRSDDGGDSWSLVNDSRTLQTRSWYYMHVFADPKNADVVWVLNAPALKSIDGGRTFHAVPTPHGDNHDLWIHPEDPKYLINANDGGANISTNGGHTWSTQTNQPTAQFYRVAVDEQHPYRVYGGQQDNSAIVLQSRSTDGGITERHWVDISGCESADPAFDRKNPRYVYGGCYQGLVSEWDSVTHRQRDVMAYPYLGLSVEPRETRYRFNWNAPLLVSSHDPGVLYHAGNVLLRSTNRGQSWQEVSPDLTRDEEDLQGHGGGPITSEGAGGEVYGTILSLAESPFDPTELWVGTDDGLVKLTRDGGATWRNITPEGPWSEHQGDGAMINTIELSPHEAGKAYLAITRYKWDDLQPLIFVTRDHGATWQSLSAGIPAQTITRVVREDPERAGLLYAGTEKGLFVSWDDGGAWQNLQLGLPLVPITDLEIHRGDLVVATHGRSYWIVDDLTPVRQMSQALVDSELFLLPPRPIDLAPGSQWNGSGSFGSNPPAGLVVQYLLKEPESEGTDSDETDGKEPEASPGDGIPDEGDPDQAASENVPPALTLEIFDSAGNLVRQVSSAEDDEAKGTASSGPAGSGPPLTAKPGLNRWVWDLVWQEPARVDGVVVFGPISPTVGPGTYRVRLSKGGLVQEAMVDIEVDPRGDLTAADYAPRRKLLLSIRNRLHELHDTANRLLEAKAQVQALIERVDSHEAAKEIRQAGEGLIEKIDQIDEELVQRKHANFQDIINYPARLNGAFSFLLGLVDMAPPINEGHKERFSELEAKLSELRESAAQLIRDDLAAFNALFDKHQIPAVILPEAEPPMPDPQPMPTEESPLIEAPEVQSH